MNTTLSDLAFHGKWSDLLPLLRNNPDLVNSAKEPKGYTPLHQAAWHGASSSVVGQLLAFGANPSLRTHNKGQTAREIAEEKHPKRGDLSYLLTNEGRTVAQLMRKVAADSPALFGSYDGNQVIFDRLVEAFTISCCSSTDNFEKRYADTFKMVTGRTLVGKRPIRCIQNNVFGLESSPEFWSGRFHDLLSDLVSRAQSVPLEREWMIIADLFEPAPGQWGLRGDPFLWAEMRHAFCHVPIPDNPDDLAPFVKSAFFTLTGSELSPSVEVRVDRFARGGMSSGMVSGEFWSETFIPMVQERLVWLQESWADLPRQAND